MAWPLQFLLSSVALLPKGDGGEWPATLLCFPLQGLVQAEEAIGTGLVQGQGWFVGQGSRRGTPCLEQQWPGWPFMSLLWRKAS